MHSLTRSPADGISIPSSYSAHLAPLSSSKLYNNARVSTDLKGVETPYVVMFQNINILSGDGGGVSGRCGNKIQLCWEFEHPRKDATVDERGNFERSWARWVLISNYTNFQAYH